MAPRRSKGLAASRRRVEDEGDEEGVLEADLDDESLSEGSIITEVDGVEGDEVGKADTASTASPQIARTNGGAKPTEDGKTKRTNGAPAKTTVVTSDMDMMLNGLKISEENGKAEALQYEDLREDPDIQPSPVVVNSTAQMDQPQELPHERRRREHDEYRKKRDADPAFVPNRGAFFMHDHRHSGPAANGFRPFGRGRGRGRGVGGSFAPSNQMHQIYEPSDGQWTHDMHEIISEPSTRNMQPAGHANGNVSARVPTSNPKSAPPNRALSTTKHVGNVQVRVYLSHMDKPLVFPGIPVKQYTRLPDHRPPLRRDKPVRISLPDNPPRYIYPAVDRSFIFIPRAMRPNQQGFGGRGRGRSNFGSIGGYSRRTSVFGGSVYGSTYTPSVAMSRRSSLAREVNRDSVVSPSESTMSKPVVKLPPTSQFVQPQIPGPEQFGMSVVAGDAPLPQAYPLPQNPAFRENRPNPIPMHQPRPQKAVSVADIESPARLSFNPPQQHQQPFHQQVPIQVNGNNFNDALMHTRNPSYPSQASTGTPLSQIPERAIHAQPFQPNPYQQQQQQQQSQNYYPQQLQSYIPQPQGYYYPQSQNFSTQISAPPPNPPTFAQAPPQPADASGIQGLVAQEVNGMVYYYDAAQIPAVATFPAYQAPQTQQSYPLQQVGGVMGMGGMMTPSPDGFYYPQTPQGMVYYPQ